MYFFIRFKPTTWLRNFPVTSGAVDHQNPMMGPFVLSPFLTDTCGMFFPQIAKVVVSDPEAVSTDGYVIGDRITIFFNRPTNMASFAPCDSGSTISSTILTWSNRYCCSKDICDDLCSANKKSTPSSPLVSYLATIPVDGFLRGRHLKSELIMLLVVIQQTRRTVHPLWEDLSCGQLQTRTDLLCLLTARAYHPK